MSENNTTQININVSENQKSAIIGFVLWFFLGMLGIHRIYMGKITSGIAMAAMTVIGGITAIFLIGYFILVAVWVWWIIDLVLMAINASKGQKLL
ncbi:TM2 domain-containing protein [Flexibacterium corallicola]|uniref:TM2 domain-containing protein n=1 Tax=Flexibacterium corallicola TaxID=3037259 RepID=UPI00286F8CD8|nr:TM2 domain-containing protein [Pseudovibrio sp. M1P-2-3]